MAFLCALLEILELPTEICIEVFGKDILRFFARLRGNMGRALLAKSPEAVWRDSVRNTLITIVLGLLTVSVPLFAHHGNAAYDTTKRITVKATVTEWVWSNPHCFLKFDAKDDKGNAVHWVAETSNPSDMVKLGWSKETFKAGDEATITFIPVRNGNPIGRIQQVVLANGQTLSARVGL